MRLRQLGSQFVRHRRWRRLVLVAHQDQHRHLHLRKLGTKIERSQRIAGGAKHIRVRSEEGFAATLHQFRMLHLKLRREQPAHREPDFFRYFAGLALSRRDAVIPVEGSYLNYTLRTPIGIVANCTPFNHPLMILCKSLAAVLASGCVTVVKPSEYTPLTTLKLAQIFTEAGLPPGVFNVVLGLGQSAGKMLAEHPDINKLVLTGGTEAGRIAGGAAAKVFAHQTMELGGKTPVMVFDDFDVDQAVNYAAFGAFIGAGQTCVCASRHIVQASIYDEFVEKLKAKTQDHPHRRSLRSRNPARPGDLGAAARPRAVLLAASAARTARGWSPAASRQRCPAMTTAISSSRRCLPTSNPTCASSRRKCSGPSPR